MRILKTLGCIAALILTSTAAQAVTVTQTFGVGTSFDDGPNNVSFTLAGLDPAVESDLAIDFTFFGDLNAANENFEVFVDNTSYGVGCDLNTGNGDFGLFGLDLCLQSGDFLTEATLLISSVDAIGLLADGALDLVFAFSAQVNDFIDITNGGGTSNGVIFTNTTDASFGVGGTISYEATDPAPIPVPPALPMLMAGLFGLGLMRRKQLT